MQGYSRRVRVYKDGYLSVCVYLNVTDTGDKHYDTVIYRKVKVDGKSEFRRGANLKPADIPVLRALLAEADAFLRTTQE